MKISCVIELNCTHLVNITSTEFIHPFFVLLGCFVLFEIKFCYADQAILGFLLQSLKLQVEASSSLSEFSPFHILLPIHSYPCF